MVTERIILKKGSTPGVIPGPTDLADGEVAINVADGKAYFYQDLDGVWTLVQLQQITEDSIAKALNYTPLSPNDDIDLGTF